MDFSVELNVGARTYGWVGDKKKKKWYNLKPLNIMNYKTNCTFIDKYYLFINVQ